MTSRRAAGHPGASLTGHIRVEPALNEIERAHLSDIAEGGGTLRGTSTGRGDRDVPFARLGWEVCPSGCCLRWDRTLEEPGMMGPTLRFLIDHLLRCGARAEGRDGFDGFTFGHVLDGAVMGGPAGDVPGLLVTVVGNSVSERSLPSACEADTAPVMGTTGRTRRGKLPANVIEFRPRRA